MNYIINYDLPTVHYYITFLCILINVQIIDLYKILIPLGGVWRYLHQMVDYYNFYKYKVPTKTHLFKISS